jgi:hypothetical protein
MLNIPFNRRSQELAHIIRATCQSEREIPGP